MYIKSLELNNYRCFEHLSVNFAPDYTVLVGVNGSGKSTILDGIATALGSYVAGFDGILSNGISQDDAHLKVYELGSRVDAEAQYPVNVAAVCSVDGSEIQWRRSLHGEKGRTHIVEAKAIMDYGSALQQRIRQGDKSVVLPLIAYYGTGRLYVQKKQKKHSDSSSAFTRTTGYIDCLDSASNEKQMLRWFEQMTMIELQEGIQMPELSAVKNAMAKCFSGNDASRNAKFEYKVKTREIEVEYMNGSTKEKLPMRMLSDGVRITISMVADIAYRMALLNPQLLDRVLEETPGIVLIDEIDMHLHPEWQRRIMGDLKSVFPKVQFIVTTHAPSVLVNVKSNNVLLLDSGNVYAPNNTTYGRNVDAILREMMGVDVRPSDVVAMLREFYESLSVEDYPKAKELLENLEQILGTNDSDYIEAKVSYDIEQVPEE